MNYKVTAVTPLLVGDGRELSPVDYMVWKDQVNVLDQNRIFKLLARGPRLEGYLTQLRKATKLDFASWGGFAQNFSARRIPFEHSDSTNIWNGASSESLFIPTFASNLNGAYVPASALKGALRTALVHSRWSASTMERVAAALEHDRLPRRVSETTEASAGASQVRVLSIADSGKPSVGGFRVYLTRTASLNNNGLAWKVAGRGSVPSQRMTESTPTFAEMAGPGTAFEGTWQERTFLENPELTRALGWRSVPDVQTILNSANEYARAQIEAHAEFAKRSGIPGLGSTIERLRGALQTATETKGRALLCVGWGGGYLSKAAYQKTDDEALRKVLRTVPSLSRGLRDGALFPKTRRIVFTGGQPATLPGWVQLQLG